MTLITLLLILSLVVFVHELGHFVAAKICGVVVYEFAIGMGPKVLSKEKNGTLYSLRALPVGGFVRMKGEDAMEDSEEEDLEGSFKSKPPLARIFILLAGIFMNFVLAITLLLVFFSVIGVPSTVVADVVPGSPAMQAGIQVGDEIVSVNGKRLGKWENLSRYIAESGERAEIVVLRQERHAATWAEHRVEVIPKMEENRLIIGVRSKIVRSIALVVSTALTTFGMWFVGFFGFLANIFKPNVVKDLVGPVGLYQVVGQVASSGWENLLYLTGYISLNVGIVNLFPIPAFDGGRTVMVVAEMMIGKPLNRKLEMALIMGGFMVLIGLMLFTFFNDFSRLGII